MKFVVDRLRASDVPDSVTTLKLTEEQRTAAEAVRAEKEAKRNWITIRVAPEGLATLSTAGIGYDVVAAGPPPATPPRVNVVIGGQRGAPTSYRNRRDWPEAECRTAFGKTACGYHCKVGFGDVKCARSRNGACKIAYGEITCSQ